MRTHSRTLVYTHTQSVFSLGYQPPLQRPAPATVTGYPPPPAQQPYQPPTQGYPPPSVPQQPYVPPPQGGYPQVLVLIISNNAHS